MQADNKRQGQLVLMEVPAPLSEIIRNGNHRFAISGQIIGATLLIDDGTTVHEVRFIDSDARSDISWHSLTSDRLPIDFEA